MDISATKVCIAYIFYHFSSFNKTFIWIGSVVSPFELFNYEIIIFYTCLYSNYYSCLEGLW